MGFSFRKSDISTLNTIVTWKFQRNTVYRSFFSMLMREKWRILPRSVLATPENRGIQKMEIQFFFCGK